MAVSVEHPLMFVNGTKVSRSARRCSLLSQKCSKKEPTRRPLLLISVESLVCTVGIIEPSHSAGAGRDALPRVRRYMPRRFFLLFLRTSSCAIGAEALSHSLTRCSPSSDVRCRIARERVLTSRNGIAQSTMSQQPIKSKYVNEMPSPPVLNNQHNLRPPAENNFRAMKLIPNVQRKNSFSRQYARLQTAHGKANATTVAMPIFDTDRS